MRYIGPRFTWHVLNSTSVIVLQFFIGTLVEEHVREVSRSYWHVAFLVAPALQFVFAGIAVWAAVRARRGGRFVETVFQTLVILFFSEMIIQAGISHFRRYSWIVVPAE